MTFLIVFCFHLKIQAQSDSSLLNDKISSRYIKTLDKKLNKYYSRLYHKSIRTLEHLSDYENRLHSILLKSNPELAKKLFSSDQETFASLLLKIRSKADFGKNLNLDFNEFEDKLKTNLQFLASEKVNQNLKVPKSILDGKETLSKVDYEIENGNKIRELIKVRRKQLIEHTEDLLVKKYLCEINKEAFYYNSTLKNYQDLFSDENKVEKLAFDVLKKSKLFNEFFKQNSQLASLFRVPSNFGSVSTVGYQTRLSVNEILQERVLAGGMNANNQISQNISLAQSKVKDIKEKLLKWGGNSDVDIPNFKPNNQKTKTFLQRIEVGIDVQSQKINSVSSKINDIGISIGYLINDKITVGVGSSYKMTLGAFQHLKLSNQGVSLRSFMDLIVKKQFFISGGIELNHLSEFQSMSQFRFNKFWVYSGLLGLEKQTVFSTKFLKGTNVKLLYDFLAKTHNPSTPSFVFRVGYKI